MNLTNCPACQKQISNSAETCPHCGHPIKKIREQKNYLVTMIVIIVVCLIAFLCYQIASFIQMSN